jgi:hypothetical protein
MNIEYVQQGIRVSTIINGVRLSRLYSGYTRIEACAKFEKEIEKIQNKEG